jgi:hypothetical protein
MAEISISIEMKYFGGDNNMIATINIIPWHRGWKGPFNYFQLCFLLARVKYLNIKRYIRSNKVEIVEF